MKTKKTDAITAAPEPAAPAEVKPTKKKLGKTAVKKPAFTTDDIALRAYFISEKRRKLGLPGDPHQDWIEAERELTAESAKKPAAKKIKKA